MSRLGGALQLLAGGRQDRAIAAEHDLRAPLPVIRRVAFAALSGGTGCTTTATHVAVSLAARRTGGVLLVDAVDAERRSSLADRPGVETLTVPAPVWPEGVARWRAYCEEQHRTHELTLTDWGVLPLSRLFAVGAHSHLVCLTTTTERAAVQRALDTAAFMRESGIRVLLVATAVRGRPGFAARRMLASAPISLILLPHDQSARRPGAAAVGDASAVALAQLGAAIVRACGSTEHADFTRSLPGAA